MHGLEEYSLTLQEAVEFRHLSFSDNYLSHSFWQELLLEHSNLNDHDVCHRGCPQDTNFRLQQHGENIVGAGLPEVHHESTEYQRRFVVFSPDKMATEANEVVPQLTADKEWCSTTSCMLQ